MPRLYFYGVKTHDDYGFQYPTLKGGVILKLFGCVLVTPPFRVGIKANKNNRGFSPNI